MFHIICQGKTEQDIQPISVYQWTETETIEILPENCLSACSPFLDLYIRKHNKCFLMMITIISISSFWYLDCDEAEDTFI